MEILLNLAWLAIAIAAFARLGLWAWSEPDRARVWFAALATVCLVALLFPIISITDDLQATDALVEETVGVRRVVAAAAYHAATCVVAAVVAYVPRISLTLLGFVPSEEFALPSARPLVVFVLRGPPRTGCC